MLLRHEYEKREEDLLAPVATLASRSKGRKYQETECEVRTAFQRDRDRILHSKSFRRLKSKTQVFIAPEGDHYRTRLTHTLEVSQISRTISRALALNEDLTEAIALGHDLGHTPFGHAGEEALNKLQGYFRHNEQSLRVVDYLEQCSPHYNGLNLTYEVRDGILNHTGPNKPSTLEGQIIRISDRIAYLNHDIDDAIRGQVIKESDIPQDVQNILGNNRSQRIDTMVKDLIINSDGKNEIIMSNQIESAMNQLREFLFANVYVGSSAKTEEGKVFDVIRMLYEYYLDNPQALAKRLDYEINMSDVDINEVSSGAIDYIAGMTDSYAILEFQRLFLPKGWPQS